MSDSSSSEGLKSPQVLTTIITGIVTVVVAVVGVLPNILNGGGPEPTAAPIVIVATATSQPATAVLPTDVPPTDVPAVVQPTTVPPTTVPPTSVPPTSVPPTSVPPTSVPPTAVPPTAQPTNTAVPVIPTDAPRGNSNKSNVRLLFDDATFTLLNDHNKTMTLEGVVFRSAAGEWEARSWGPSVYNSLPKDFCLRLRDQSTGQRNPPSECGGLHGLILVGTSAIFWRNVDSFDVYQDDTLLATCSTSESPCSIEIPQK